MTLVFRTRILEYRDESQRLDQCGRLYDSSVSNEGFELDTGHIVQVLTYDFCGFSLFSFHQNDYVCLVSLNCVV